MGRNIDTTLFKLPKSRIAAFVRFKWIIALAYSAEAKVVCSVHFIEHGF